MVGKKWLKLVKSLHQKKYRNEEQLFFVEGRKAVDELLGEGFQPVKIVAYPDLIPVFEGFPSEEINAVELKKISALKNPNGVLGVFEMPRKIQVNTNNWILALDSISDPGNLGTIIRLCDWFGIEDMVCSPTTVDCYNPKVLQATMGSIARVNIHYKGLPSFFEAVKLPVLGTFMDGDSMYSEKFTTPGILLMGNEANGISPVLEPYISKRIGIPQFGAHTAESLNVAMATGILLNEIRRSS